MDEIQKKLYFFINYVTLPIKKSFIDRKTAKKLRMELLVVYLIRMDGLARDYP